MMRLTLLVCCMVAACFFSCADDNVTPPSTDFPRISISSVTLFEGQENSVFSFKVSTSADYSGEIKVDFATEEITAGETTDFIYTSGTLIIPTGAREGYI